MMSNKSRTKIYFLLQDKKYQAKNVLLQEKTNKNKQKSCCRTKKRICPVAGQQAELQRVLCDDEQKEAAVDFGLPGGEVFKDKSTSMSCKWMFDIK